MKHTRLKLIEVESQIIEGGYTLGEFNRYYHAAIEANAPNPAIISHDTGHLRYERGRGVVKTQEADCSLCEDQGLNDGQWHQQ